MSWLPGRPRASPSRLRHERRGRRGGPSLLVADELWPHAQWRGCHFCSWRMYVTTVDAISDVRRAYAQHIKRHAEAADVALLEQAVFDQLIKSNYP
jgi:hypothetical protein